MRKKPNSTKKLFNLDNEAISIITDGARIHNMNKTEFLEFLTFSWAKNFDPKNRLEQLKLEKISAEKKRYNLEKMIKKCEKEVEMINNWQVTKFAEKPKIIRNLIRILKEKRYNDAEEISRLQSKRFGIPALELLTEALNQINSN